ncbi:unnamed protein product [Pseudo-nitzschia multistriata]|uniref:Uncharacterized protein n=1 Tax=Pseudo-nitzschia multistriata TaxID=183589 RepID=A0A448YWE4_9STRA|nr:unnamed protein product [Pseudo-nitzschia multistriata]
MPSSPGKYANDKDNDMPPPPHKRQRVSPEATGDGSPDTASFSLSPRNKKNFTAGNDSTHSSAIPFPLSVDAGPIFTEVEDQVDGYASVESVLGVPAYILFRRVGGNDDDIKSNDTGVKNGKDHRPRRRRPLLTRQEMEQFLRLTLLAQEIDVLVNLSETVLSRRRFARHFRRSILMQEHPDSKPHSGDAPWKNPWLVTLGPILDVLEQKQYRPDSSLRSAEGGRRRDLLRDGILPDPYPKQQGRDVLCHVHEQITRLCHELQACGVYELERSAEQNRSLVASLTDIVGYDHDHGGENGEHETGKTSAVRILAKEKHALSRLQDHLSRRVRSLLAGFCFSSGATTKGNDDGGSHEDDNNSKQILFDDRASSSSTVIRTGKGNANGNEHEHHNEDNKKLAEKSTNDKSSDTNIVDGDSDDDESSLMSLEEAMTPLELICEKLFAGAGSSKPMASSPLEIEITEDSTKRSMAETRSGISQRGSDEQRRQTQQQQEQTTKISRNTNELNSSNPDRVSAMATASVEASQRTAGAAAVMMALATDPKPATASPWREPPKSMRNEALGSSGNNSSVPRNRFDGTNPKKPGNDDDGSFVEDPPPSDAEDYKEVKHGKKKENSESPKKKGATKGTMGIFDVVDVFTPSSPSEQQPEEEPGRGDDEVRQGHDGGPSDRTEDHLSSLSSQSQTAAEALTRMVQGNSFRYH